MPDSLGDDQQPQCLGKRKRNGNGSVFAQFPAEIIDHIALCFVTPFPSEEFPNDDFPLKLRSLRLEWDALINYHDDRHSPPTKAKYYLPTPDIPTLLGLRLVSSVWNASASRVLRQYAWWLLKFDRMDPINRVVEALNHPQAEGSGLSRLARKVKLSFRKDVQPSYLSLSEGGEMMESPIENAPRGYKNYHGQTQRYSRMEDVFNSLSRVEALHVEFPSATSESSDRNDDMATRAGCYDLQALGKIFLIMHDALNLPAFEHLTDLRLAVPVSHDVQRLGNALSQEARDRLKHLWIGLQDATGAGGKPDYTIGGHLDDYDEDSPENEEFMPGNLQLEYPNRFHQQELWDFVASCRSLEHLGIECTQYLDLEYLDWTPAANSQGLKTLDLKRVYATIPALRNLLKRGTDFSGQDEETDPSIIRRIALQYVKIKKDGGNWAELFDFLHDYCDDLEILRVTDLTYYSDHENYEAIGRIYETSSTIFSGHGGDWSALRRLLRTLVSRAGGVEKYPRRCLAD